jgi:hypothetical protein
MTTGLLRQSGVIIHTCMLGRKDDDDDDDDDDVETLH